MTLQSIRKECYNEGKSEGETLFASLVLKLFGAGRASDVELAANDEEVRRKFYKEFGMID